jgi:hypothetical protein
MKIKSAFILTAILVTSLANADATSSVAVVGIDSGNGDSATDTVTMIDSHGLSNQLAKAIVAVQSSAQSALALQAQPSPQPCLILQAVGVGIALTGVIGLGPIVSVSVQPHLRLIFTNNPRLSGLKLRSS